MNVVVTGGSSGIGKQTALRYARRGARLTILARHAEPLRAAAAEIEAASGPGTPPVTAVVADVADPDAVTTALGAVGPVDVLVCCAGVACAGRFGELPLTAFSTAMTVNYLGTVHTVRAVLEPMLARGTGQVVLVASGAALIGLFGYTAYGPSKFAVRGFAESLRAELAGTGVGVSVVYLPDVDTPQLAAENRHKPPELRAIAGTARVWTAAEAAERIVRGVDRGEFVIAGGLTQRLLVVGHSVLAPLLRPLLDGVAARARAKAGVTA